MKQSNQETLHPILGIIAAALAWLIPGAGHLYLGRWQRALIIFLVITLTFWTGMALGGVLTVDYYYERWWFLAQMFAGIHGVIGWYMQDQLYDRLMAEHPEELGKLEPVAGPVVPEQQVQVDVYLAKEGVALTDPTSVVARAYSGVAGLLNLMCIFDALALGLMGVRSEPTRTGKEQA
ncbi:MAG: DUF6677 family protein [Phycisphaerae bacterium]